LFFFKKRTKEKEKKEECSFQQRVDLNNSSARATQKEENSFGDSLSH